MNELDSLRQEAETLKNTIRVSAHSFLTFIRFTSFTGEHFVTGKLNYLWTSGTYFVQHKHFLSIASLVAIFIISTEYAHSMIFLSVE